MCTVYTLFELYIPVVPLVGVAVLEHRKQPTPRWSGNTEECAWIPVQNSEVLLYQWLLQYFKLLLQVNITITVISKHTKRSARTNPRASLVTAQKAHLLVTSRKDCSSRVFLYVGISWLHYCNTIVIIKYDNN